MSALLREPGRAMEQHGSSGETSDIRRDRRGRNHHGERGYLRQ
jgi:hypothetical protein